MLGGSASCIATHPSDMAVALAALDAEVVVRSSSGERKLTTDELYRLPADSPDVETSLRPDELVTGVEIPALPDGSRSTYRKVRDHASFEFAVVSVAAALTVHEERVTDVRIALGGVAPRPWRARVAEAQLVGGPASRAAFDAAITTELAAAEPLPGNAFKVSLTARVVSATLSGLTGPGGGDGS